MIRHTVVFKLRFPKGSHGEREFLEAASRLQSIPGVLAFESLRQVSPKNDFDYGLSMEFASKEDYETYNRHPSHTLFVQTYWDRSVEKFIEINYERL